ncbi:hypothetical protein ACFPIF_19445 [Brevundimonas faecalis]|uniref:hypothetical protein n=1 Tax=Brevundimonas faecalis TaxID=947378 RepID=UPI00360A5AE8
MTPLLDAVLPWVRSQTREADPRPDDKRAEDARMVKRVLSGEDGAAFLTLMARMSVLQPPLDPALSGGASHDYAQRRTGANSLFAALIFYRDLADKLERTSHGTDPDARSDADPDAGDERFTGSEYWDPQGLVAGR